MTFVVAVDQLSNQVDLGQASVRGQVEAALIKREDEPEGRPRSVSRNPRSVSTRFSKRVNAPRNDDSELSVPVEVGTEQQALRLN